MFWFKIREKNPKSKKIAETGKRKTEAKSNNPQNVFPLVSMQNNHNNNNNNNNSNQKKHQRKIAYVTTSV